MTTIIHQPNLTEGLSLIGWRLKRDAEIQARQNEANFECEVEPSSTSYAAFEYMSATEDDYDPYAGVNLDLCLEVDAMNLNSSTSEINDDYDPYEVFMRLNTRRTVTGRTSSTLVNNYRHYNFADDDTPIKYPLAIGLVDKRSTPQTSYTGIRRSIPPRQYPAKRVTFRSSDDNLDIEEEDEDDLQRRNKLPKRTAARIAVQRFRANDHDADLDNDIAPTVTEMDMLEDEDDDEPITKSMSSPVKPPPPSLTQTKSSGSKSSYIGNMLPSFYEQLPESKKMLLQDATVDSSHSPGGEEIIDQENRLQFRNTIPTQEYKRVNNLQGTKRYYENEDMNLQHPPKKYQYDRHQDMQEEAEEEEEEEYQQTTRVPARRGRPPSQQYQEDPSKKHARIIAQFEEQHGLKLGEMRVYAPKLRLRISSVNVNWINLPLVPKFPHKVHQS